MPYCKNDSGGGGSGTDPSDPTDPTDPDAPSDPAITTSIYLWAALCSLRGDIQTDGGAIGMITGCGATGTGITAADALCNSRYATDAGTAAERAQIASERGSALKHRALLSTSSEGIAEFDIPDKGSRELYFLTTYINTALTNAHPGGKLADSYDDYLDPAQDALRSLVPTGGFIGGTLTPWMGSMVSGGAYVHDASKSCNNWISASNGRAGGEAGISLATVNRLATSKSACDSNDLIILCLSY